MPGAVTLVVMEPGAEWPTEIDHASTLVAFVLEPTEPSRLEHALGVLGRERADVREAVLACSDLERADGSDRRWRTAQQLLSAVTRGGSGRLIVTAPAGASTRLQQDLLALADGLRDQLAGTSAAVRLRLRSDGPTEAPRRARQAQEPLRPLRRASPGLQRAALAAER